MTLRFTVGQIVVCLGENMYGNLAGAVGEITDFVPPPFNLFGDYQVHFPGHAGRRCGCGKHDITRFYIRDQDLKPLDDPDAGRVESEDKVKDFGFVA